MINTGIEFDMQHTCTPSKLANSHFWDPSGAPTVTLKGAWAVPDLKIHIYCFPMIYTLNGIKVDIEHAYIHFQLAN